MFLKFIRINVTIIEKPPVHVKIMKLPYAQVIWSILLI